jgi:hypothetical protein
MSEMDLEKDMDLQKEMGMERILSDLRSCAELCLQKRDSTSYLYSSTPFNVGVYCNPSPTSLTQEST